MFVLGDISGIQNYLFDVAEEGGRQAQRLRARSFFLQLIPEVAALRTLERFGWSIDHMRSAGAGKFLLQGSPPDGAEERLRMLDRKINEWLLSEMRGELRFALGWSDNNGSEADQYRQAMARLQEAKASSFKSATTEEGRWDPSRLVLAPLETPCALCRHQRGRGGRNGRRNGGTPPRLPPLSRRPGLRPETTTSNAPCGAQPPNQQRDEHSRCRRGGTG